MNTMTYHRSRGLAALAIVAIACLCVAACGSSSSTTSTSSAASAAAPAGGSATRAKLSACLKQHGVTLPSRPGGRRPSGGGGYGGYGGGGFFGGGGGGGRPGAGGAGARFSNPKFRAAIQACGGTANFRGRRNFRPTTAAISKFASCVKQHGYTLPKPNLTGKGPVYPASIEKNAKFQAASKACTSALRPAGRAGGGGGAPPAP